MDIFEGQLQCPKCLGFISGTKYCYKCGTKQVRAYKKCQCGYEFLVSIDKYCPNCGKEAKESKNKQVSGGVMNRLFLWVTRITHAAIILIVAILSSIILCIFIHYCIDNYNKARQADAAYHHYQEK